MARSQELFDVSLPAAADYSAKQHYFMTLNSSRQCVLATTLGEKTIGVLQDDPDAANRTGLVRVFGITKVVASAAITVGARVTTDASGKAITATPGDFVAGVCIIAAGADGDVCSVLLGHSQAESEYLKTGFIPLPVESARELSSNEYQNLAAHGGVMANDSTPILEAVNPGTDQISRLRWAASDVAKIAWNVPLPPDLDEAAAITLHSYANMASTTDTPVLTWEAFFNVGDTDAGGATAALSDTLAEQTVTIAAGDVPAAPGVLSLTLAPGAHGTDAAHLYGAWLEYTRK